MTAEAVRTVPRHARLSAAGVLRSEWVKLRSVRSSTFALLGGGLLIVGFGLLSAGVASGEVATPQGGATPDFSPTQIAMNGVGLAQLVVGVLGVLAFTSECSTGTARTTFAAVPRRLPVLWSKAAVVGTAVLAVCLPSVLLAFVGAQAVLDAGGEPTALLSDDGVLRAVLGSAVYLSCVSVLGVALGTLLRSAAAALSALVAGLLLVPGLLGAVLPSSWEDAVLPFLPSTAGEAFTSATSDPSLLSPGAGCAVLAGWVVALLAVAAWRLRTRDV
jgi:ABC-type transport system involved in multi-copper enzyme maturation permease subunit